MSGAEVNDIAREAVVLVLKMSAPAMVVALIVGVIVSFFQALTQIQEATLSFAPKIIAMFLALLIFLPYMGQNLVSFTHRLTELIAYR